VRPHLFEKLDRHASASLRTALREGLFLLPPALSRDEWPEYLHVLWQLFPVKQYPEQHARTILREGLLSNPDARSHLFERLNCDTPVALREAIRESFFALPPSLALDESQYLRVLWQLFPVKQYPEQHAEIILRGGLLAHPKTRHFLCNRLDRDTPATIRDAICESLFTLFPSLDRDEWPQYLRVLWELFPAEQYPEKHAETILRGGFLSNPDARPHLFRRLRDDTYPPDHHHLT
jgi:hypothetical protein